MYIPDNNISEIWKIIHHLKQAKQQPVTVVFDCSVEVHYSVGIYE